MISQGIRAEYADTHKQHPEPARCFVSDVLARPRFAHRVVWRGTITFFERDDRGIKLYSATYAASVGLRTHWTAKTRCAAHPRGQNTAIKLYACTTCIADANNNDNSFSAAAPWTCRPRLRSSEPADVRLRQSISRPKS